jgi:hypothetical protein
MKTSSQMSSGWSTRICFLLNCGAFWVIPRWFCLTVGFWNCLYNGHATMSFDDMPMLTHPVIGSGFSFDNDSASFLNE